MSASCHPGGYQAPVCTCGHGIAAHSPADTHWPHPSKPGICLSPDGCDCKGFTDVKVSEPPRSRGGREAARRAVARATAAEAVAAFPWKLADETDEAV